MTLCRDRVWEGTGRPMSRQRFPCLDRGFPFVTESLSQLWNVSRQGWLGSMSRQSFSVAIEFVCLVLRHNLGVVTEQGLSQAVSRLSAPSTRNSAHRVHDKALHAHTTVRVVHAHCAHDRLVTMQSLFMDTVHEHCSKKKKMTLGI